MVEVLPPPPPGVYGRYARQHVEANSAELGRQRAALPALPPLSLAGPPYSSHTVDQALAACGALHGQRVRAKLRLSVDDQGALRWGRHAAALAPKLQLMCMPCGSLAPPRCTGARVPTPLLPHFTSVL